MITKDMTIREILGLIENAESIFAEFGMGCIGCPSSVNETLEEACKVHNIDLKDILYKLNEK